MESFGRTIAVIVCIIGVASILLFSKTVSVRWQRHETIRSMSQAFVETILRDKAFYIHEWNDFQKNLWNLGSHRAELTVYERRRFENEDGGFYLYEKAEITEDRLLREGCYVRLLVISEENENKEKVLPGDGGVIVAGGRVQ